MVVEGVVNAIERVVRFEEAYMRLISWFILAWLQRELLWTSLPLGILVKGFEDRMDLFSVMISGTPGTPYEGGLFFFDIHLTPEYPSAPPKVR